MKTITFFLLFCLSGITTAQWIEQTSPVTSLLYSVSAVNDNVVWACGAGGVVLRTADAGNTWSQTASPNSSIEFFTIQGIDALTAIVSGSDANTFAYKTIDGGATWTQTFSQAGGFIDALKAFNGIPGAYGLIGDPVGGRWTIFESNDYGSTWDSTGLYNPAAPGEAGWNNSYFVATPGSSGWYGTKNTKVINAFSNGTYADLPTPGLTNSFAIWGNDNSRLMTGGDNIMLYSADGGASWANTNAIGTGDIAGIVGHASRWWYARGSSVYFSTDDGANWTTDYTTTGTYFHMTISLRGKYLWAVRDNGGISRYESDIPLPVELSSFSSSVNGRDVSLNWTTSTELNNYGFDIERSVNFGQWSKVGFVAGYGTTSNPVSYSYSDRGLISGKYNYRLKQSDFNGNYTYYDLNNEISIGVPSKFSLSQNYPNPFNPSTKINYEIPYDGNVSLKVYDISGKEVMTLVNDFQTAGSYSVNFNSLSQTAGISSGVYVYRITSGDFSQSRKMILAK